MKHIKKVYPFLPLIGILLCPKCTAEEVGLDNRLTLVLSSIIQGSSLLLVCLYLAKLAGSL
jgi:hypothetical protein